LVGPAQPGWLEVASARLLTSRLSHPRRVASFPAGVTDTPSMPEPALPSRAPWNLHSGETFVQVPPTDGAGEATLVTPGSVPPASDAVPPEPMSGTRPPTRAGLLGGASSVEEQLRRLESRLLAEVGGDPAGEEDLRRHLTIARARFVSATVRQFLPILIERDVRRRLAAR
jgi:hypothetical protein